MATTEQWTSERTVYREPVESTDQTRSFTDLIRDLRDESMELVQQEVALAKTEMNEKISRVSRNGAYLAAGGAIAFAGLVVLLLAASAGLYVGLVAADLSHFTAGWLAPLIVGGIVALIGYGLVQKAISALRDESLVPERTAETLREDKQWIERKVR